MRDQARPSKRNTGRQSTRQLEGHASREPVMTSSWPPDSIVAFEFILWDCPAWGPTGITSWRRGAALGRASRRTRLAAEAILGYRVAMRRIRRARQSQWVPVVRRRRVEPGWHRAESEVLEVAISESFNACRVYIKALFDSSRADRVSFRAIFVLSHHSWLASSAWRSS